MATVPSPEELQHMAPDERIKRLREAAEQRKKELEDTKKQVEAELSRAEELISSSEKEKDEEEQAIEKARERLRELQEETAEEERKSLEEMLQGEAARTEENGVRYDQPSALYNTLPEAVSELERLYGRRDWSDKDVQTYNDTKERIERAQHYSLSNDKLAEELGLGISILNRMKYR